MRVFHLYKFTFNPTSPQNFGISSVAQNIHILKILTFTTGPRPHFAHRDFQKKKKKEMETLDNYEGLPLQSDLLSTAAVSGKNLNASASLNVKHSSSHQNQENCTNLFNP